MHRLSSLLVFIFLTLTTQITSAGFVPPAPTLEAKAWVAIDYNTGKVLAESKSDLHIEPASLAKLMTAYVVFNELKSGNISLTDEVLISKTAWDTGQPSGGSHMYAKLGAKLPVKELLKGMIIVSGNEASVALAEFIAGDEATFASMMNNYAKKLGMTNSNFTNSTGWPDPKQYTSARDIAVLTQALIRDFPEYYKWYSVKEYKYDGYSDDPEYQKVRPQSNRNLLLWRNERVDGVKTGHTESVGYNLVASSQEDGMRVITAVFGAKSMAGRANESQKLLSYAYRFFETHRLYEAGAKITETKVWKGRNDMVALGLKDDLYVTVPRGLLNKLNTESNINDRIIAPVEKDAPIGTLSVTIENNPIEERPLVALDAVNEGGTWKRIYDAVQLMLE